jgi:hypothetical protein
LNSLNFQTSKKEFIINNDPNTKITFDPGDPKFLLRLSNLVQKLEPIYKDFTKKYENLIGEEPKEESIKENIDQVSLMIEEIDQTTRTEINAIFGYDACQIVFGTGSLCSFAGERPIWMGFILAIKEECENTVKKTTDSIKQRTKKYLDNA